MKQSAGTLLYRDGPDGLEVLLVHPSGNYNRKAPWSIPKGVPNPGEDDHEVTARRETMEETGVVTEGPLVPLGSISYRKSRKQVHCFAGPAPAEARPQCASWEVDQVCFVSLARARTLLHPDQAAFIDRLEAHLAGQAPSQPLDG